ncbi:uncharacterized protein LALA0_S12e03664g [Lachancea lanzarotensis]|uniref:LALA0S12e03664g1_1 n=1 Tax=Lachancea lanzarotensis TaxID=1245769 RepID=A0A0C7NG29_9SACH|nr:uncharacterized protein LALA0_S12e03664g [Lachancea lanzarotensis]CEP64646.1 LALA0S12e03664g1_1 [Lachancea lanzarotensis]
MSFEMNKVEPAQASNIEVLDTSKQLNRKVEDEVPKGEKSSQAKSSNEQKVASQDLASLMGFSGFESTKNKKVQPKKAGGKMVEKKATKNAKYRQYVNRKNKKLVQ